MLVGDSQTRLEVISCSCCLSKRNYSLSVGRHSTGRRKMMSVSSESEEQLFSHKGPWQKGLIPEGFLLPCLWASHGLTAEFLSPMTLFMCLIMGCFQVSRSIFLLLLGEIFLLGQASDCSPALLTLIFQEREKNHAYREGYNTLLNSGLTRNQNPGDTVAFPTEEDLVQVPRDKSIQITEKEIFDEFIHHRCQQNCFLNLLKVDWPEPLMSMHLQGSSRELRLEVEV